MTSKIKTRQGNFKQIIPEFSSNSLTNFSGVIPFSTLLFKKLKFHKIISKHLELPMAQNKTFSDSQIFASIIFGFLCGFSRIFHFQELTKDTIIQRLMGLSKPIDENTFAYRLKRFSFKTSNQLNEAFHQIRIKVHNRYKHLLSKGKGPCIIDLDSSVKSVYGNQEGAEKGYNDRKRGARSYHPLLAFLKDTKECIHTWFRPGNTYTSNGSGEFLKECWHKLPRIRRKYLFRADSGFFSNEFLSRVEKFSSKYLVKVKLKNMKSLMNKCKWESIPELKDTEYSEFYYQCSGWKKSRKFVAIRILKRIDTEGLLFPIKIYEYHCFVTNLEEAPIEIYSLYKDRGECENWIEAVKGQIGAGKPCLNHFWANDVLWNLAVFTYNLTIWLRYLTCKKAWRQEPETFRRWFIQVAGKLIYSGRIFTMKMQRTYFYRKDWENIYNGVVSLQFE